MCRCVSNSGSIGNGLECWERFIIVGRISNDSHAGKG